MKKGIEFAIAEEIKKKGGRAFYVGGVVRDSITGRENKDIDIEIHGLTPDELLKILKKFGPVQKFGDSFGVYSLSSHKMDIALPRKEHLTGKKHRDFEIEVDPFIGVHEAARRRDFTINSLYRDVLTDEIVDEFNGLDDLKKGILRCTDPKTFVEDPLRVLRAAQFAARFNFKPEEKTLELCKHIDLSALSKERVFEEMKKALLKSEKPSVFFKTLRDMNQLDYWFKEIQDLIGIKQDSINHPEGDVFIHTMEVLDRSAEYRSEVSDPLCFALLAITHDFGKVLCTTEENGRIHSYNHETLGLPLVHSFITRLTNEKEIIRYLMNMVPLHMKLNAMASQNSKVKSTSHHFDKALKPKDLVYFSLCDAGPSFEHADYLFSRYSIYEEIMKKPEVKGADLIRNGIVPNEHFSEYLDYAHKLHLSGVEKQSALKQTLSYIKEKE